MFNGKISEEKGGNTHAMFFLPAGEKTGSLLLLDSAFFAKALSNRIKAGLLTYSIPCTFPRISPQWHIAQNWFQSLQLRDSP
jgi:hypothetical protein